MTPGPCVTRKALMRMAVVGGTLLGLALCVVSAQGQAPQTPPAAAAPATAKSDTKTAPRPHRVITNDELPSRTPAGSSPEVERRLQQVNFCDHACFQAAFKDSSNALHQHWPYPFTMQENQLIEDALLRRLDQLRADPEWQSRLRNMIVAHLANCEASTKIRAAVDPARASGNSVTAADLAAEEAALKENDRILPSNNAAGSALLSYRQNTKDPLKSALMLHQYFDLIKAGCPQASNPDP